MHGQLDRLVRLHRGRVRRQVGRRQRASLARGAAGARPLDAHVRVEEHAREAEGAGLVGDCADVSTRTCQARLRQERRRHDDHVVGERLTSGVEEASTEDRAAPQRETHRRVRGRACVSMAVCVRVRPLEAEVVVRGSELHPVAARHAESEPAPSVRAATSLPRVEAVAMARRHDLGRRHSSAAVGVDHPAAHLGGASRVGSRPPRGRAAAENQGAEHGDLLRVHESLDAGRPSSGSWHRARRGLVVEGRGSRGAWPAERRIGRACGSGRGRTTVRG